LKLNKFIGKHKKHERTMIEKSQISMNISSSVSDGFHLAAKKQIIIK